MITSSGRVEVFKYFDARKRNSLGYFADGILIGDTQVTFDTDPTYTIETVTYCNIGIVPGHSFKELFIKFPEMKRWIVDEIIWNPFDNDRDDFVRLVKKHVDYFKKTDDDVLKKLFYRCKQRFYGPGQCLFDLGDHCEDIVVILSGVLDIMISDGASYRQVIDSMGRGSVIGMNFVLKHE